VRIVIAFLCLLFAVFLLSYKKGSILSNRLLGIFLLTYLLLNCNTFVWIYNIYTKWPHIYNFAISFQFLLGPLLLLYSLSVVHEKFRLRKLHLLHFLPFVVVAVIYFFLFQIYDTESKLMLLRNGFRESPFFEWEDKAEILQKISYILGSVFVVFKYPWKKSQAAFYPEKHLLGTLKFLLICLLTLMVTELIRNEIPMQAGTHYIIKAAAILVYLVMISTLMVRGLLYPEMFSGNSRNGNGRKYHKSPLTREHKIYYLQRILSYMDMAEPYLSSSVNLTDFAKEISIPSRYLSQVLNEELGMSFYDFMNKYRINKAGKLLADPGYTSNSIIDVAWECGFNSKSVFNAAFKKYKGMTPSEFRMEKLQAIFQDP
jgi:AraC-like DNA-binding protein